MKDIVHLFVSRAEIVEPGETTDSLQREQQEEADTLERDKARVGAEGGLFRGCFNVKLSVPIHDESDGVLRCPLCIHELEDMYCPHCQQDFGSDSEDFSDTPEGADSFDDTDIGDNDSIDSFGDTHSEGSDISRDREGNSVHAQENNINGDLTIRPPALGGGPRIRMVPGFGARLHRPYAPPRHALDPPRQRDTSPISYTISSHASDLEDAESDLTADHDTDLGGFIDDGPPGYHTDLDYQAIPDYQSLADDQLTARPLSDAASSIRDFGSEVLPPNWSSDEDEDDQPLASINQRSRNNTRGRPVIEISSDDDASRISDSYGHHQSLDSVGHTLEDESDSSNTVTSVPLDRSSSRSLSDSDSSSLPSSGSEAVRELQLQSDTLGSASERPSRKRRRILDDEDDEDEDAKEDGNSSQERAAALRDQLFNRAPSGRSSRTRSRRSEDHDESWRNSLLDGSGRISPAIQGRTANSGTSRSGRNNNNARPLSRRQPRNSSFLTAAL